MARTQSRVLTDHDEIRRWAEERNAQPACVRRTGGGNDIGMIRLDFPGYSGEQSLEHIGWDEWFGKFDESKLALLVQDTTAGGQASNFNKLIARDTARTRAGGNNRAPRRRGTAATSSRGRSTRTRRTAASTRSRRSAASRSASRAGGRSRTTSRASSSRSTGTRARRAGAKRAKSTTTRNTARRSAVATRGRSRRSSATSRTGSRATSRRSASTTARRRTGTRTASASARTRRASTAASRTRARATASRTRTTARAKRATASRSRNTASRSTSARSRTSKVRSIASGRRSGGATVTTDRDEIRRWAEARGAEPACVRGTGRSGDIGVLRLDFPGYSGRQSLQHISWDDWFEKFDERGLALLHQDTTARGQKSNFNKLIARENATRRGTRRRAA